MKTKRTIKRTILTKLACLTALFTMLIGSTLTVSAEETAPAAPTGYTYNRADGTAEWREGAVPAVGDNGLPVYIRLRTDGSVGVLEMSGITPGGVPVYGYFYKLYTPEQVALLYNAIDAAGITNEMSQYDKCVAINNYVCAVMTYGQPAPDPSISGPAALEQDGLKALQRGGIGVCGHYTDLYQTMCEAIGITCRRALGTANNGQATGSHGWNEVVIDGKVYYVDSTWNDTPAGNRYLMSETLWSDHTFGSYSIDETQNETDAMIHRMFTEGFLWME